MKVGRRKLRFIIFLCLLAGIMIVFHSCVTFRMTPKEIDQFFSSKNITGSQHSYATGFRTTHYVKSGDESKPLVLFVHGSPGSLSAFIDFLADTILLQHGLLITADRPGFGYSNFGYAEPSLKKQAETLRPILEKYRSNKPVVLVGHSLGGPLIARMAIDYPDMVDGLILVAGSIDPELEPNETWFRAPLATPFLSWILPRSFRASNEEIYHLKPELEKMLPQWKEITCPVIVIHGKKDNLVAPGNTEFARKMLVNAPVEYMIEDDVDHFIPWKNPGLIRSAVLKLISRNTNSFNSPAH